MNIVYCRALSKVANEDLENIERIHRPPIDAVGQEKYPLASVLSYQKNSDTDAASHSL